MTHLLAVTSMALYVAATALMLFQLWRPSRVGRTVRAAQASFFGALTLHTALLALVLNDVRYVLLENGADYFLIVSWGLSCAFAALQTRLNYPIVAAFLIPSIVLFMGSSSYLLHQETPSLLVAGGSQTREEIVLSLLHGIPALVAVVSLALALVVSAVFLIVDGRIKARSVGALSITGPNLQLLDMLNQQFIQVGFVAISFVVVSGSLWAVSQQKPVFSADTSVVSGLVTWMLLAFILHVRLVLKWSPKKISRLTVLVTASFFVTIFAVMALAGRLTHAEFLL